MSSRTQQGSATPHLGVLFVELVEILLDFEKTLLEGLAVHLQLRELLLVVHDFLGDIVAHRFQGVDRADTALLQVEEESIERVTNVCDGVDALIWVLSMDSKSTTAGSLVGIDPHGGAFCRGSE